MKPLLAESEDKHALETLGRASVQIVHDLKNQLNGLKLYATFLRKRMEKTERAEDELDTIRKLIAGLDRTAEDLSMISEYGHPVHIHTQPVIDLQLMLAGVAANVNARLTNSPRTTGALAGPIVIVSEPGPLNGEFDSAALEHALKAITIGALKMMNNKAREGALNVQLRVEQNATGRDGLIEWEVTDTIDADIFHSFAGSEAIRMSLAARVVEAHGGSAECGGDTLRVRLPLAK
ncbi:MAG: HAMP domain-containing histidine kinase [Pyrinomonadaceae bacterium]|nr:HAMP domain-containing histidine kinase [Pyrinomonadaceae bacterium]